jgi:hypothetical protein
VRDHDHRLESQHVGRVVLENFGVALEAVAPAERLVGEPEAREVHRAHAVAVAQLLGNFEPVDAARRKAVDQHERGRVRVTELDVEDLHLGGVAAARSPPEVAALLSPDVTTIHAGDYFFFGPRPSKWCARFKARARGSAPRMPTGSQGRLGTAPRRRS